MSDSCTGACCRKFSLTLSPEELDRAYRRALPKGTALLRTGQDPDPIYNDIHLIAPMVVYLGDDARPPRYVNPRVMGQLPDAPREYFYRCKHFDGKAKVCTIYDIRPQMCRDYPSGGRCNYAACTWTERKEVKGPKKLRVSDLVQLPDECVAKEKAE